MYRIQPKKKIVTTGDRSTFVGFTQIESSMAAQKRDPQVRFVCVGIPNYNGLYMLQNAGGARGLQKAGTNEDLSAFL